MPNTNRRSLGLILPGDSMEIRALCCSSSASWDRPWWTCEGADLRLGVSAAIHLGACSCVYVPVYRLGGLSRYRHYQHQVLNLEPLFLGPMTTKTTCPWCNQWFSEINFLVLQRYSGRVNPKWWCHRWFNLKNLLKINAFHRLSYY